MLKEKFDIEAVVTAKNGEATDKEKLAAEQTRKNVRDLMSRFEQQEAKK